MNDPGGGGVLQIFLGSIFTVAMAPPRPLPQLVKTTRAKRVPLKKQSKHPFGISPQPPTPTVKGEWYLGFSSSLFASHWLPMTGTRRSTILVGPDLASC